MPNSDNKAIFDAYKEIVKQIIDSKKYKEYAEAEIKALDQSIFEAFKSIRGQLMNNKKWV